MLIANTSSADCTLHTCRVPSKTDRAVGFSLVFKRFKSRMLAAKSTIVAVLFVVLLSRPGKFKDSALY
jgi:hypothetical protein